MNDMTEHLGIENQAASPSNADAIQALAADPTASVWVGASAGTGKTKVLTDRLLRLMLPQIKEGQVVSGTAPHHILCLTFTKVGAAEMKERLSETLQKWSLMSDPELHKKLTKLLSHTPHPAQNKAARELFAQVIDTPGGLKIMTIHAFCQSVLVRFPLEAGIHPGMEVVEEAEQYAMLRQAFKTVIEAFYIAAEENDFHNALSHLLRYENEDSLLSYSYGFLRERKQLMTQLDKHGGLNGLSRSVYDVLSVDEFASEDGLWQNMQNDIENNVSIFYDTIAFLSECGVKMEDIAFKLKAAIENKADIQTWIDVFYTQTGNLRKLTKKVQEERSDIADLFELWGGKFLRLNDQIKSIKTARLSCDLITFGVALLQSYDSLKKSKSVLDFDDLIYYTNALLKGEHLGEAINWVMFKLDGGIDHILVDEAQDTNPEQWEIIQSLSDEFFAGISTRDEKQRTLFVVGDEKQSIFSFQRADIDAFAKMNAYFKERVTQAQEQWRDVPMNISFRTTQGILDTVDSVFAHKNTPTSHSSFRGGQAAHIELWPLFESERAKGDKETWPLPTQIIESNKAGPALAAHIASTIKSWMDKGRILESRARPVEPKDIMILVPSRTKFVQDLMRALKAQNLPVSGADRMVLTDEIAVMDLMNGLEFSLQTKDDLALATLLKSPFIQMSEDQLFDLAHGRDSQSLWQWLKKKAQEDEYLHIIYQWCDSLVESAATLSPFAFLNKILFAPAPADDTSGLKALTKRLGQDCLDPIEECLSLALKYEQNHTSNLQHFLRFLQNQQGQLKRETLLSDNVISIMTAHGSKGLQAPIVFLPDTTRYAKQARGNMDRLLWPHKSQLDAPIWAPYKDIEPEIYTMARDRIGEAEDKEYDRLLYVAMTRAEDELYIGGVKKHDGYTNWYHDIKSGLRALDETREETFECETPDGVSLNEGISYVLSRARDKDTDPDRANKDTETAQTQNTQTSKELPIWVSASMPKEPNPPRPLTPSKPSEAEPHIFSPLNKNDPHRFRRGNITHTLLQFLPDISHDRQPDTARLWLEKNAHDLPDHMRRSILKETLAILDNPDYAMLFGPESHAEVPVTGLMDGKVLSGQIDRLYIAEDAIWIIDYKTNRPSPKKPEDIPNIYIKQMRAYANALKNIYPNRVVKAYLLWTDGPNLMAVEDL